MEAHEITPLTPDLAPMVADLMDDVAPASRCSCMYWRIGSGYRRRSPHENRISFLEVVEAGPPPGLVAIERARAIGWCQVTQRTRLPALVRSPLAPSIDDTDVWSISCFVIRKTHRRTGLATALIGAAIEFAQGQGGDVLEAYPVDADQSTSSSFTGYASTFARLGFDAVAQPAPSRPVMRLEIRRPR